MIYTKPPTEQIEDDFTAESGINLMFRREDLNHPLVSGNKWWKLKYNLEKAAEEGHRQLLTFGGAWSNHIYATAAAARILGYSSIGIIRGEQTFPLNPTLAFARSQGMHLHYVSREEYRRKNEIEMQKQLHSLFGKFYMIPEGGTNALAVRGCEEWGRMVLQETRFDYLCLPVGTGGTLAGLAAAVGASSKTLGFSVLKNGGFLNDEINRLLMETNQDVRWNLICGYDQGGYAKSTRQLEEFIRTFYNDHKIPLEPVYSGKMMFGIYDLMRKGFFEKGSRILAIHTGGLQARTGIAH